MERPDQPETRLEDVSLSTLVEEMWARVVGSPARSGPSDALEFSVPESKGRESLICRAP